jgi:hypothetical protein
MKDYNYWLNDWPKIVTSTFAHGGKMFEMIETKDTQGLRHYTPGRELTIEQALENARADRRVSTMTVFANNGKHETEQSNGLSQ